MVLEGNPEVGSPQTSDLRHPGSKGSCVLSSLVEDAQPGEEPLKYGELIVLGCCEEGGEETEAQRGEMTGPRAHSCYNGCLASGDKGRRRSRLALSRRPHANGVKPDVMHHISTPLVSKALSNRGQHSISYTLSRSHSVIVEYTQDSDTDMFQIGRSTENMIDFVVTDTSPGGGASEGPSAQSTISRYACRILCDRRPPYTARIYAAGFDASSNIFLGERAAKWRTPDGLMDGLTTNGVLVMHPAGGFSEDSAPGVWREISVCGNVYTLRDSRSAQQRGKLVGGLAQRLLVGALPTPSRFPGPTWPALAREGSPALLPKVVQEFLPCATRQRRCLCTWPLLLESCTCSHTSRYQETLRMLAVRSNHFLF
ncbi:E3 ubiquitin-protein ligase pellino homolog 3 isoform X3 [Tenrec ecaudatus]|uniref:E3 ubiquitin-protein ligase pellino homolog 3 isoform X3 n=1 Tax=Tenrec ecaudatus TaxID=94439 RepID=UPI003F5ADDD9